MRQTVRGKPEHSRFDVNADFSNVKCLAVHADVTKEADMERAVKEAVDKFGRIDYAA